MVYRYSPVEKSVFPGNVCSVLEFLQEYCERLSRVVAAVGENHCKLLVDWNDSRDGAISMQFLNFALVSSLS